MYKLSLLSLNIVKLTKNKWKKNKFDIHVYTARFPHTQKAKDKHSAQS